MLCNISISTVSNNLSTFYKTNYNIDLFYPFLDRLMEFDFDEDILHDEFTLMLTKDDLSSISTSNIKNEDYEFINELNDLFNKTDCECIEIDGCFKRFIRMGELN